MSLAHQVFQGAGKTVISMIAPLYIISTVEIIRRNKIISENNF